MPFIQR